MASLEIHLSYKPVEAGFIKLLSCFHLVSPFCFHFRISKTSLRWDWIEQSTKLSWAAGFTSIKLSPYFNPLLLYGIEHIAPSPFRGLLASFSLYTPIRPYLYVFLFPFYSFYHTYCSHLLLFHLVWLVP
jgi:hypothetical protein